MNHDTIKKEKTALLLLGCPQVPVQTSVAIYLVSALKKKGVRPVIAGNSAARNLIETADPDHHYVNSMIDIDRAIGDLAEGKVDYWATFVFIHNDAGISYAATVSSLSEGGVIALIYGEEALKTADSIQFPCEKIAVKAVHNPVPLKKKIDEVLPWAVSNL